MRLLIYPQHTRKDIYEYTINSGGEFCIQEHGDIQIEFENGVFKKATFPFQGTYTRNGWRILAAIETMIAIIEKGHGA